MANEKIAFVWDSVVTEVLGSREGGVHGLKLENTKTGEESEFSCQGMFVAIGHQPNTQLFAGRLDTDTVGYLKVEEPSSRTSLDGVFACGDVMDPSYRQAVTAAGSGCRAAIDAERWLEVQD